MRLTTIPGPSRRPCTSMYKTPLSTETWESNSCHTYGTIFSRHHQLSSASQPTIQPHHQLHNTPYWSPFLPSTPNAIPLCPNSTGHYGKGVIYFLFTYGEYMCLSQISPLLIYNKSYSSVILVSFLHFIC